MGPALIAGLCYFAVVFAIGFALGTIRVLALVSRLGENASVLFEIPVMLTASYFVARWLVERFAVPAQLDTRLTMGFVAFASLMLAELVLSLTLMGRSVSEHFAHYGTMPGAVGLGGQIAFALIPVMLLR